MKVRLMKLDRPNPYNGLTYTKTAVMEAINKVNREAMLGGVYFEDSYKNVEFNVNLSIVGFIITDMYIEGDWLYADITALHTPSGDMLADDVKNYRFAMRSLGVVGELPETKVTELQILGVDAIKMKTPTAVDLIKVVNVINKYTSNDYQLICNEDEDGGNEFCLIRKGVIDDHDGQRLYPLKLKMMADFSFTISKNILYFKKCRSEFHDLSVQLYKAGIVSKANASYH